MLPEKQDEQVEVTDGVEYRYSSDWTTRLEDEFHWRLYWRQQHIMEGILHPGDELLEIGPGTGFTRNYLQARGYKVTTFDIDEKKRPDIVANIVTYPFDKPYDAVLAFEVFEHIPFNKFRDVLPKITAICRKALIFSVPRNMKTAFHIELKLPKLKPRAWQWRVQRRCLTSPHHFWEIDYNGVRLSDVEKLITDCGLRITRRQEAFDRCFFVCQ